MPGPNDSFPRVIGPSTGGGGGGPGFDGSADLTLSGDNLFTDSNLFLFDTTDSTTPRQAGSTFCIAISNYGDPSPSSFVGDLMQFWSFNNGNYPQTRIRCDGVIDTGSAIVVSANTTGSLAAGNFYRNGPFDNSNTLGGLAGVISYMVGVRSDIVGAAVQIGVTSIDPKNVCLIMGTSSGAAALGGTAYIAFGRLGQIYWDAGGAASSGVLADGSGNTTDPTTWADFQLAPADENTLKLSALTATSGIADFYVEDGGVRATGDIETTGTGKVITARIPFMAALNGWITTTGAETAMLTFSGVTMTKVSPVMGIVTPRAGSVVGVAFRIIGTAGTPAGSPTLQVYNGTSALSGCLATVSAAFSGASQARTGSASFARGTHAFSAANALTLEVAAGGVVGTFSIMGWLEVVFTT